MEAWWEENRADPINRDSLFKLAETMLPEVVGSGPEKSQRIKLGKALSRRVGWRFARGRGAGREKHHVARDHVVQRNIVRGGVP